MRTVSSLDALAAAPRRGAPDDAYAGVPLEEARQALAYWEDRERRLPRHAMRRRHEARAMAQRWRADVAAAERTAYGRGLLGALLLVVSEGRLPEPARHAGRQVARRSRQVAIALVVLVLACVTAAAAAVVEALAALVHALG